MKRLHLLYATPRSGSTPISLILAEHLRQNHQFAHLPEYFALNFRGVYQDKRGEIELRPDEWENDFRFVERRPASINEKELAFRYKCLLVAKKRYFFKVFPYQMWVNFEYTLLEKSHIVFLYRQNLFEQMLSYQISMITGDFYKEGGILAKPRSLKATQDLFERFCNIIWWSWVIREKYRGRKAVSFEECMGLSPDEVVRKFGYKGKTDWSRLKLPEKQNKRDKLELFKNPDELVKWYRRSALMDKFPL